MGHRGVTRLIVFPGPLMRSKHPRRVCRMNLRAIVVLLALFAALALAACGESPQWQGTIEERDGVIYVHSPAEGLWDDSGVSVRFELEQVFGVDTEPAEAILNGIWRQAFDVDDQGNVYIFDGGDDRLVSFAPDGSLRWSGGGPGQGPGEFSGAEGMAWNGASMIYVTNGRGARIDLWSTDGQFVESLPISHLGFQRGTLVGVLDENTVVLQASSRNVAGVRVGVIDLRNEGSIVADFDVDIASGPTESGAEMEVEVVDGSIAIGDWDSYDLRFYSRTGKLERIVSREFDHLVLPASREERQTGVYASSWLKPPLLLAGGLMLATASWTDPDALERLRGAPEPPSFEARRATSRGSFDLFDTDGRYLTSIPREEVEIGNADEVGADGKLYTVVRDPFPQVRRYRVVIES